MYTKHQKEYIASVDGEAHQSALDIIAKLEDINKKMHIQVAGYLHEPEWTHWVNYNKVKYEIDD